MTMMKKVKLALLAIMAFVSVAFPASAKCVCHWEGDKIICKKEKCKKQSVAAVKEATPAPIPVAVVPQSVPAVPVAAENKPASCNSCNAPAPAALPQVSVGLGLMGGASFGGFDNVTVVGWGLFTGNLSIRFADNMLTLPLSVDLWLGAGISPTSDIAKQHGGIALGGGAAFMAHDESGFAVGLAGELLTDVMADGLDSWGLLFGPKVEKDLGKYASLYWFLGMGGLGATAEHPSLRYECGTTLGIIVHTR